MDPAQVFAQLNWLAVIAATLAGFLIGGLWYGPLFGKEWMALNGITMQNMPKHNLFKLYGTTIFLNLIAATSLAMFVGNLGWQDGLLYGFITGLTFVATAFGVCYLFESRPLKLWCINAGYNVVFFSVMGTIIGAWHR
jgi:Protein of unknown function (DUF1761)